MSGHIVFIAPDNEPNRKISDWVAEWVGVHRKDIEPVVYLIPALDLAHRSLARPVRMGDPPALILVDHTIDPRKIPAFTRMLRDCIPESWIIELPSTNSPLPSGSDSFLVVPPVHREELESVLAHVLDQAATPQWSRATSPQ